MPVCLILGCLPPSKIIFSTHLLPIKDEDVVGSATGRPKNPNADIDFARETPSFGQSQWLYGDIVHMYRTHSGRNAKIRTA